MSILPTAGHLIRRIRISPNTKILEKINFDHISSSGYAYQIEFKFMCAYTLGARVKEIPIIFKSRRQGESKISNQVISEGVILPIKLFFKRV